ncbi:hypothetical protein NC653_012743 [Populus alba x Populus x berolinensis]|uniref:Uncharacterized protein n=1 Tax=Populus alba x Populus x berolinensis TaxID=444605 RepID=A0AAD6QSQ6_9ROSI|nr:hypothetical protein NC653_012743 [Populus alba x Populus x berolinensis]
MSRASRTLYVGNLPGDIRLIWEDVVLLSSGMDVENVVSFGILSRSRSRSPVDSQPRSKQDYRTPSRSHARLSQPRSPSDVHGRGWDDLIS